MQQLIVNQLTMAPLAVTNGQVKGCFFDDIAVVDLSGKGLAKFSELELQIMHNLVFGCAFIGDYKDLLQGLLKHFKSFEMVVYNAKITKAEQAKNPSIIDSTPTNPSPDLVNAVAEDAAYLAYKQQMQYQQYEEQKYPQSYTEVHPTNQIPVPDIVKQELQRPLHDQDGAPATYPVNLNGTVVYLTSQQIDTLKQQGILNSGSVFSTPNGVEKKKLIENKNPLIEESIELVESSETAILDEPPATEKSKKTSSKIETELSTLWDQKQKRRKKVDPDKLLQDAIADGYALSTAKKHLKEWLKKQ